MFVNIQKYGYPSWRLLCIRVREVNETYLANKIASRHLSTTTEIDVAESAQRDDTTTMVGEATPSAIRDNTNDREAATSSATHDDTKDGEVTPKHATSGATGKTHFKQI